MSDFIQGYFLKIECETCEEPVYRGTYCLDGMETKNGLPVLDVDFAVSQITFECDNCGGRTYTGDWDQMADHEPGTEPDEDNEDDES